jgi:hypothetical protein
LDTAKPFVISKKIVWQAYLRVKASKGAAGVDDESIADFERALKTISTRSGRASLKRWARKSGS